MPYKSATRKHHHHTHTQNDRSRNLTMIDYILWNKFHRFFCASTYNQISFYLKTQAFRVARVAISADCILSLQSCVAQTVVHETLYP